MVSLAGKSGDSVYMEQDRKRTRTHITHTHTHCNTYMVWGKTYTKVIVQGTWYITEPLLGEGHFRRGCTDAFFAVRQLTEKAIERDRETIVAFIVRKKTKLDRVNRNKLLEVSE